MKKTRILIADDHSLMRYALKSLFSHQADMTVVGEACDGREAVRLAGELAPNVVLMDLMMPVVNGADATKQIKDSHPEVKIVIITSYSTADDLVRAVSNGASGAMLKSAPIDDVVETVRIVHGGKDSFPHDVRRMLCEAKHALALTDRQIKILTLAAEGLTNQQIAVQLSISPSGVNKQLLSAYQKLGAASRAEAITIASKRLLLNKPTYQQPHPET
jgi:two-component system NarL family response regulator